MRTQSMVPSITVDPSYFQQKTNDGVDPHHQHGINIVIEEIEGIIKVYKDGHVDRPQIVPCVPTAVADPELDVTSRDTVIDKFTNIWARFYAPKLHGVNTNTNTMKKLPLLVYFHGGGFCVGSAAWSCYHAFLEKLAAKASCLIMSVNYRLAPEHPLPAAYEDGLRSLVWLKQQAFCERDGDDNNQWWSMQCDFSRIFLVGDSAGANIAHNVSTRLCSGTILSPLIINGQILVQPFFGGEARTSSEKYYYMVQPRHSVLNLAASDTYWRLALPPGSSRDHPWCNPLANGSCSGVAMMVCISELDILKDRDLEFCGAMGRAGKKVEYVVYKGVGHAFQVLDKSRLAQTRCHEMITHIKAFVDNI